MGRINKAKYSVDIQSVSICFAKRVYVCLSPLHFIFIMIITNVFERWTFVGSEHLRTRQKRKTNINRQTNKGHPLDCHKTQCFQLTPLPTRRHLLPVNSRKPLKLLSLSFRIVLLYRCQVRGNKTRDYPGLRLVYTFVLAVSMSSKCFRNRTFLFKAYSCNYFLVLILFNKF